MKIFNSKLCKIHHFIKRCFSKSLEEQFKMLPKDLLEIKDKSDVEKYKTWSLYKSTPESFDQSLTNIFLFPGYGSQYVGMCRNLVDLPQAKKLFQAASEYLNYDLLKMCLEGPSDKLNTISYSHPAIYVATIATLEKIRQNEPELIEKCIATAGYDFGEITSLVFAGVLSFEQGLHIIRVRAEEIEKACQNVKGGLLMVRLRPKSELKKIMLAAKKYCIEKLNIENPVCELSTNMFTECKIIGGHIEAIEFIETFSKDFRLRSAQILNVSGAFNTNLMKTAVEPCKVALRDIGKINKQNIIVFSNTTGNLYTPSCQFKKLISEQIYKPLRWEQIIMRIYMRPASIGQPTTIVIGSDSILKRTVQNVNANATENYRNYRF